MGCLGYSKCFELYSVTNDIPEETMLENEGCVISGMKKAVSQLGEGESPEYPQSRDCVFPSFAGTSARLFDFKMWGWNVEVIICDSACVKRDAGIGSKRRRGIIIHN